MDEDEKVIEKKIKGKKIKASEVEKKIKASEDAEPDVVAHKKIKGRDGEPAGEQVIEKKIKGFADDEPDVEAHIFTR